jgi:hypothetical protein
MQEVATHVCTSLDITSAAMTAMHANSVCEELPDRNVLHFV